MSMANSSAPRAMDVPPFGKIWRGSDTWDGKDVLVSWHSRPVELLIERVGDEPAPAAEQAAGYSVLKSNEKEVAEAVLEGIYKYYIGLRKQFQEYGESLRGMPVVMESEQLKGLMKLNGIHVSNLAREGMAYVGLSFSCTWDDEHGLGVMMHGKRVVSVGEADVAFDEQYAEGDGGKRL
jgi:hypothetical protein